ncbi:MAG: 30S ribosomal protein S11 [Planctomycetes bacterium]|nr:30S ribosomal protein S11 [Planctomycetota bacterium]
MAEERNEREEKEQSSKVPPSKGRPEAEGGAQAPEAEGVAPGEAAAEGGVQAPARARRVKRTVERGVIFIKSTFNNTIVTATDPKGQVLCWASGGTVGFTGSRKGTPFAAQRAADVVADKVRKMGMREVEVKVNGPGAGRESAATALQHAGLRILTIEDVTPLPHNGCRRRKKRRV